MAFEIKNGVLWRDGKQVPFKQSPNVGGPLKASLLVMHYTASQNAAGAISWLCNPAAKASAHLVIDQAGAVTQLVPFTRQAWHAGVSSWKKRTGCNQFSIGIELANPGPLSKREDGKFYDSVGNVYPANQVVVGRHKNGGPERPWCIYPPAQIAAAEEIARTICNTYGIKEIVGHEDVAPTRKIDPGFAFPMASFVTRVLGRK